MSLQLHKELRPTIPVPVRGLFIAIMVTMFYTLLPVDIAVAGTDGLPAALKLATSRHPSVTEKLDELKSLGFDIDSALAGRYPSFSVQGQTMSDEETQVVARLQQPLWAGGRIDGSISLAQIKLRSAQAALLQIRRQLMEDTAAIYSELLGARQRLDAAEMNVQEHEKLLGLISRRQLGNIASEADVRLARSRLTQAQSQREQLRGVVEKAQSDLQALTLEPLAGYSAVEEEMLLLPDQTVILNHAGINSPAIQQRLIDVEIARIEANLRKSDMMPILNAVVERDIYSADENGTIPADTRVGLAISGNVDGLGLAGFGRIKAATALIDAAKKRVETEKNELRRRTSGLISDRKMYGRVMESNNLLVTSTQETLESFMRQYDAGRKSWVDVLNAQKELADARQYMEQTKSSFMGFSLRLAVLIGRLDRYAGLSP